MRLQWLKGLASAVVLLTALAQARPDDAADNVAKQKSAAQMHWKELFGGDQLPAIHETPHFLILGEVSEKQAADLATSLENELGLGLKALQLDPKDELWPGKLTVYLFTERRDFNSFVRGVAKKRADPDELGLFHIRGETPYIAAGPGQAKQDPPTEVQAGEQLAGALLNRKGGNDVPDWVLMGFARATVWRSAPNSAFTREQRTMVRNLVLRKGRTGKDIWSGNLDAEEAPALRGSLMEYMAFGPAAAKFSAFLDGFKPEEGKQKVTAATALAAAKISPDALNSAWQRWALAGAH